MQMKHVKNIKFDEEKHFFVCKKFNKEIKMKLKNKGVLRLKRHILEKYRVYLIEKKGKNRSSLSEFKLFTEYLVLDSIIISNRITKDKFKLHLDADMKTYIEQAIQLNDNLL